ncbi:hypothetical protein MKW98_001447 [Papaver atlanticum]|uniref:Rab escort protein n=1 Tax=Papaver atlanticum TaxID=357466 RepID=A0AAD4SX04_9MAGN|nr:hypothetical protein MKW98_001447 [Papaver atlanticum]
MSEEENVSYPTIDPSVFDLIVVGTGLPESIIAANVSVAGKTILHVDANSFYGSSFSSLLLDDITSFLHAQKTLPESTLSHGSDVGGSSNVDGEKDYVIFDPKTKSIYSDIEISSLPEEESVKACSRNFIYGANGELSAVPDSRSAIFKDRRSAEHAEGSDESRRMKDEDLESPFVEFLNKQRLPTKMDFYSRSFSLLLSIINGHRLVYKGVRLASGQEILSQHLVINPSVTGPSPPLSRLPLMCVKVLGPATIYDDILIVVQQCESVVQQWIDCLRHEPIANLLQIPSGISHETSSIHMKLFSQFFPHNLFDQKQAFTSKILNRKKYKY